jgi:hypothetical protein
MSGNDFLPDFGDDEVRKVPIEFNGNKTKVYIRCMSYQARRHFADTIADVEVSKTKKAMIEYMDGSSVGDLRIDTPKDLEIELIKLCVCGPDGTLAVDPDKPETIESFNKWMSRVQYIPTQKIIKAIMELNDLYGDIDPEVAYNDLTPEERTDFLEWFLLKTEKEQKKKLEKK